MTFKAPFALSPSESLGVKLACLSIAEPLHLAIDQGLGGRRS
jgi:hypothetical protein